MIKRCKSVSSDDYRLYGARGICVCERWRHSFTAFLADMGPRPSPQHSIDRVDNNGNYEPGNCRWATAVEQGSNKRNNRFIEFNNERLTLSAWARRLGIEVSSLHERIAKHGAERAIQLGGPRR